MLNCRRGGASPRLGLAIGIAMLAIARPAATAEPEKSAPRVEFVSSGRAYQFVEAAVGSRCFIDRTYDIRELTPALRSGWLLQTSNEDDHVNAAEHLRLMLATPAIIYLCYDGRSQSPPAWLRDWTLTDERVVTTDMTSRVYRRAFRAGLVTLGGNERSATGGLSNYFAVIVPRENLDDLPEGDDLPQDTSPVAKIDYAHEIAPLLAKHCYECHGADLQEGGLRLDVRRRALLGGDTALAIHAGDAQKSLLVTRLISADEDLRMPQGSDPLTEEEIKLVRGWIDQGAPWPDEHAGREDYSDHWSYRPIVRPAVPEVKHRDQVRGPIDAFVVAKLEQHG